MPRIRYLKPEFFTDEDLAELQPVARLTFAGLWCYADKSGRLEDRPKYLKAMIWPYDSVDIEKQLTLLAQPKHNGKPFIQRYSVNGTRLIQILSWDRHQKPHHTESESKLPPAPPPREDKGNGDGYSVNEASASLKNVPLTVKEPLTEGEKKKYGQFNNVLLTEEEHAKLDLHFGPSASSDRIERLSEYLASKGKKYKDHYATILAWARKDGWKNGTEPKRKNVFLEAGNGHENHG